MDGTNTALVVGDESEMVSRTAESDVLCALEEISRNLKPGDQAGLKIIIKGSPVNIVASRPRYNFGVGDIRKLAADRGLEKKYDDADLGIASFNAQRGGIALSYTQDMRGRTSPANVLVRKIFTGMDHKRGASLSSLALELKGRFDVIVRPEGDLDAVKILGHPEQYDLTREDAMGVLGRAGREICMSLAFRLDNEQCTIRDVYEAFDTLNELEP